MDPLHRDACKAAVGGLLEVCGAVGATALVQHSGRVAAAADADIDRLHAQARAALREPGDIGAPAVSSWRSRLTGYAAGANTVFGS